ncbi:MAG TPA: FAD-dependent oxidoreductase [Gemmatimonadales bacterium]
MDLTSGAPFWILRDGLIATYPRLKRNLRCDLAVIGGGITGALVAHRFAREGIRVVLLERREIGYGSTGATTALIQYEIDTHLCTLIDLVGEAHAVRSYQLCQDAVLGIERLAAEDGDACGHQRKKSLYLGTRPRDRRILEDECSARRKIGIEVDFLLAADIRQRFPFQRPAALLSQLAGEIDAFRLTHKLIAGATRLGAEAYDRTTVSGFESRRDGVELVTADGYRLQARKAVFATGYETPEYLDQKIVKLNSTFALASAPIASFEGWGEERCLIWETARPYFYARTTEDGRVIMGGADKPFATAHRQEKLVSVQTGKLRATFARLFPAISCDVDWTWGGTFGETRDGLPYIGTVPQFPHGYFALGYGGNGITFSYIAAELLLDRFLQRPNPDLEIFRFDR